ncbi:hypothetical protein GCM10009641_69950 [Mycobacterium cookii]|uniref:Helix-turn-helix domain-containing protein n=1 Tax=Nocardioides furvisabuli TaxID=375542 RepID=A0ABP5IEH1_9ACTN|nr:hypothetical protein [Nocardioides furvisabuli]
MAEYRVGLEATSHLSVEKLSEEFYEQFDGTLVERCGRISVFVYVDGPTGHDAAIAVVPKLETVHLSIVRVDHDLVDGPEIAERLGLTRQAVQNWAKGTRGSSFPRPFGFPGGKRVWAWSEVVDWARRERKLDETNGLSLDSAAIVDAWLARRRQSVARSGTGLRVGAGSVKGQAGTSGAEDYLKSKLRSPL